MTSPDEPREPVLGEAIEDQALAVLAAIDDLRLAPLGAVHEARVALRRLRGSLKGFRPMLASAEMTELAGDLRWLAGELSDARDVQVAGERILAGLEWVEAGEETGELLAALEQLSRDSAERAAAALLDPRLSDLQGRLKRLLIGRTEEGAHSQAVQERISGNLGRLLGHLDNLDDRNLHDVRKRVKRARAMLGTAASTRQVLPHRSGAGRVLRALRDLSDHLGFYQDAVVTAGILRELAPGLGKAAALAERLAVHEDAEAEVMRAGIPPAVERLRAACVRLQRRTPGVHLSSP